MSIEDTLKRLGLQDYLALFRENHIDLALAAGLSDADLKEIGIASLGHRRKLLAAFGDTPSSEALVERRDVVILFVDLVESTALIRSADPEEAYFLIDAYLNLIDTTVRSSGGTVERHLGDAVMAVFGAPQSQGDEALRAVDFAHRVHELVADLGAQKGVSLKVRVGVAYGHVIVRSAPGEDVSVVGPSVNLAARLSSVAKAGETLLSGHVTKACGTAIVVGPKKKHELKGFDDPVESRLLLGFSHAAHSVFVGRDAELSSFKAALGSCRETRRGSFEVLRGEAGMGKSSLLAQWLNTAAAEGFATHLAQIQSFGAAQTRDVRAAIVTDLMTRAYVEEHHRLWLFPTTKSDNVMLTASSPDLLERNRRRAFEALVQSAAMKMPLVLAFEDAHWADSDMLGLIAECCALAENLPLIVIATTRIEGDRMDSDWMSRIGDVPVTQSTLQPLGIEECQTFATSIAGQAFDAAEAIERSSGHPLYLEQLLRHGQEDSTSRLPHTIHTIIQARIDLLALADRRVARAASVLGQTFELSAIRSLIEDPGYDPQSLVDRHILRRNGQDLSFHHALIRDCIYETVLREERELFHRCAADWYSDKNLARRADHLAQINAPEAALAYFDAAKRAAQDWQYADAARLACNGRASTQEDGLRAKLLDTEAEALFQQNQPEDAIRAYREIQTLPNVDAVLLLKAMIGEITALRLVDRVDAARDLIARAEEIAEHGGHERELSHLKYLRGALLFPTGEFQASLQAHDEALKYARRVNDPERIADALSGRGDALYAQGRMASAREVFDNCLNVCADHGLVRVKAQNLFMRGTVRIYALDWNGALEDALASAELANAIGNARAEVVSRLTASWVYAWTGQLQSAMRQARDGLAVAADAGAIRFKPFLSEALGHALYLDGNHRAAVDCLETAVTDMRSAHAQRFIGPWVLGSLALAIGPGARQAALLEEAETLLASGAIGHNHFQFRRLAIDAAIAAQNPQAARSQAQMLEAFTESDPTPWSDHEIARARRFAADAPLRAVPAGPL